MDIYKELNKIVEYIEDNLTNKIDYNELAKMLGINVYTFQTIFALLTNTNLSEYIRKRKLSKAVIDLKNNMKIIDVAFKYGYENATSFSRAFARFHGLKPSLVKYSNVKLNIFPKIIFKENKIENNIIKYEIIEMNEFLLYGKPKKTNLNKIKTEAPLFVNTMKEKYNILGDINYGMVKYENRFESENLEYWVLWATPHKDLEPVIIPKSKWLKFTINSRDAKEIQRVSNQFYMKFLPSCKFNLKDLPELEYYQREKTEFLVPIN